MEGQDGRENRGTSDTGQEALADHISAWGSDRPNYSFYKNAHKWQSGPSKFRCIVDNLLLGNIINGAATCTQDELMPTMENIINTLGTLMDNGFRPSRDTEEGGRMEEQGFQLDSRSLLQPCIRRGGLHVLTSKPATIFRSESMLGDPFGRCLHKGWQVGHWLRHPCSHPAYHISAFSISACRSSSSSCSMSACLYSVC